MLSLKNLFWKFNLHTWNLLYMQHLSGIKIINLLYSLLLKGIILESGEEYWICFIYFKFMTFYCIKAIICFLNLMIYYFSIEHNHSIWL
jgi:hypothetical protein